MPSDTLSSIKTVSGFTRPLSLFEWLTWLNRFPRVAILLLVVVNLVTHGHTLDGYFLADDFVHVAWLKEVFNGHFELVLKNFYSTWLQTEGTNFYRPFISVTLVIDRFLFGGGAFGYHLTNLFYQCVSTVGLYLVGRELVYLFSDEQNEKADDKRTLGARNLYALTYLPLMSALLFAVHPLHSEVVSWIIARVDSVCCAFYLLAMWLFLKARRITDVKSQRVCKLASLITFITSLISKEMAVTLPPALILLMVLFPKHTQTFSWGSLFKSLKDSFVATWHMWLILIVYLVFRAVALGNLTGGYQGSIGEGLSASTFERIFSMTSAQRVFFPLNAEVFVPLKRAARPLLMIYSAGLLLFLVRFALARTRLLQLRILAFAALWFFLVMLPTIPVWNLTETLQGSRFIYMGTAPLCLFLAALFSPIWNSLDLNVRTDIKQSDPLIKHPISSSVPSRIVVLGGLSSVIALALVGYYSFIVYGNNTAWVHAGRELKALRDALDTKVKELPDTDRLALLNLPHRYKGAHMLYNAATLSVLLAPPLNERDIVTRVATFEPVLFGDDDLVRISRIRPMIAPGNHNQFVVWKREEKKLDAIELEPGIQEFKMDSVCQALTPTDIDARGNAVQSDRTHETNSNGKPSQPAGTSIKGEAAPSGSERTAETAGHLIYPGNRLMPPVMDVDPAGVDFLDVCVSAKFKNAGTAGGGSTVAPAAPNQQTTPLVVDWNSSSSGRYNAAQGLVTTVPLDGKMYRMRIHVSQHKKWLTRGKIHRLGILAPAPDAEVTVYGIALLNGKGAVANLVPSGKHFTEDETGVIRAGGKLGHFSYDVNNINGATSVVFEVSKPNAWFEHYTNSYRDAARCEKALKSWTSPVLNAVDQPLELRKLSGPGFYELRLAALGSNGEIVGYFSDPIMFQLGQ